MDRAIREEMIRSAMVYFHWSEGRKAEEKRPRHIEGGETRARWPSPPICLVAIFCRIGFLMCFWIRRPFFRSCEARGRYVWLRGKKNWRRKDTVLRFCQDREEQKNTNPDDNKAWDMFAR